jgi:hypothetical protein
VVERRVNPVCQVVFLDPSCRGGRRRVRVLLIVMTHVFMVIARGPPLPVLRLLLTLRLRSISVKRTKLV